MKKILTFFSLFGSMSTLLCCALPVTLVTLGMGASFANLTGALPQIIWLTERKEMLFVITGILLLISYLSIKSSQQRACPIDQSQREVCESTKNYTLIIFWISTAFFIIGLCFSYIIPRIFYGM